MLNTFVAPRPSFTEEERQAVASGFNRVNYGPGEGTRTAERKFARAAHGLVLTNRPCLSTLLCGQLG
jgi:hypothetical protein